MTWVSQKILLTELNNFFIKKRNLSDVQKKSQAHNTLKSFRNWCDENEYTGYKGAARNRQYNVQIFSNFLDKKQYPYFKDYVSKWPVDVIVEVTGVGARGIVRDVLVTVDTHTHLPITEQIKYLEKENIELKFKLNDVQKEVLNYKENFEKIRLQNSENAKKNTGPRER